MKIHVLKLKLRVLHKYIGFTFSLFILHLTITGILLTYPKTFKIDKAYVSNFFILKKYNMDTYKEVYGLEGIEDEIILIKNNIYINKKFIDKFTEKILSIQYGKNKNKVFVLSENTIGIYFLENVEGDLEIKNIISLENNKQLLKIGINLSRDVIFQNDDNQYFILDQNNILKLINENSTDIKWSRISIANRKLAEYYLNIHQGKGVSLTRILTELHNGRFFGSIFTLILFFASLSLLFLTLSSFIFATNIFKNKKR